MDRRNTPTLEDKPIDSNQVLVKVEAQILVKVEASVNNAPEGAQDSESENPYDAMDRQLAEYAKDAIEAPKPSASKPKAKKNWDIIIDWFSFLFSLVYVILKVKK